MAKMVTHKGVRYRPEDAKRRGIKPDGDAMDVRTKGGPREKEPAKKTAAKTAAKNKARAVEDEASGADAS